MLAFLHHRRANEPPSSGDGDADPLRQSARAAVIVTLASDLADHAPALARALGPGFQVDIGPPDQGAVAVLSPHGTAAIAFYRQRHPHMAFLVLQRGPDRHGVDAADYLNAGADGFLVGLPSPAIAAHIQALLRRRRQPAVGIV